MKLKAMPSEASARMSPRLFPLAVALGLMTIAVYWPVTGNGFVNFDDDVYVQSNTQVQKGLTAESIAWAFTHTVSCNWHPLTMLSHMLDCQLYGLNPWGHHLTSLLFHAANTVLLFLLLHRLTGAVWRSAWVAALFALHPVHVESVAWVAERKDVLSAFFGFLTLLFYVRHVRAPAGGVPFRRSRDYWLACLCFALGLMSKPMLVTWPFVLLLLDYWPLGRFKPGSIMLLCREKIPFFCLALVGSVTTFWVQASEGAAQPLNNLAVSLRLENAAISYCRYVFKILWPENLAVYYPHSGHWPPAWVAGAVILLAGLTALFWFTRRNCPYCLMGWLWFVGMLVPVIGLVQVGSQSMADRYTYLPAIGLLILISWGACRWTGNWRHQALVLSLTGSLAIIICAGMTRQQTGHWRDSETLFRHALAVTENNDVAHNNLAAVFFKQGQTNAAIHEFQEALRINPRYSTAHRNLGNLLAAQGLTNAALAEYQNAIAIKPSYADARYSLGCLLLKIGQTDDGISQFKAAIRFQTNDPGSLLTLGNMLLQNGQTNAALTQLQAAIKITPADASLHYELGCLLADPSQMDDAIREYQEAIHLEADYFEAHNNLAALLSKKGQIDPAIGELQEATRLKPEHADAHYNLGALYLKKGLTDEAAGQFQTAIRLSPDNPVARYYLGNILIRKGQTEAAITQLREAIRLKPDYAFAHNKLGIALGTAGHLPEAIAEFQEAIRLKPDYAEASTNLTIALKMQGASAH